jgi:hypothetical protein
MVDHVNAIKREKQTLEDVLFAEQNKSRTLNE